jgi:uncharacterized membrane protein
MSLKLAVFLLLVVVPTRSAAGIDLPGFIRLVDPAASQIAAGAYDVSQDGTRVVGTTFPSYPNGGPSATLPNNAVTWSLDDNGFESLESPGERGASGVTISGDGNVMAGWILDTYPDRGVFIRNAGQSMERVTTCNCATIIDVRSLSYDGATMVGRLGLIGGGNAAYRWTRETGAVRLTPDLGDSSTAWDVSADGSSIVGDTRIGGYSRAFLWNESTGMLALDLTPRRSSNANGVSADGKIVVGFVDNQAFRWELSDAGVQGEAITNVPDGIYQTEASAVSGDGQVVVGNYYLDNISYAFRWSRKSGLRSIADILDELGTETTGWQFIEARGVSYDGSVIVGSAIDPTGQLVGFAARLPANYVGEPASAVGAAIGISMILLRRRRPFSSA